MSYSDEWPKAALAARQDPRSVQPVPIAPAPWKPWAEMTAEERRKALEQREDATPGKESR